MCCCLLPALFGDLRAHLALETGAEMWIQCLTPHFVRKANLKAHACTRELYLRAFSGTVAIQLAELFNPLSLQKGKLAVVGNGLSLRWSELGWELFWKVLSGP